MFSVAIQFPDNKVLKLSSVPNTSEPELDDYVHSEVSVIENNVQLIETVTQLRKKVQLTPHAFKLNNLPVRFSYNYLPGGVYFVSIKQEAESVAVSLEPVLNTIFIDYAIKKAAEFFIASDCKGCSEYFEKVKTNASHIVTLKTAALSSFTDGGYVQTNRFIEAAERYALDVFNCIDDFYKNESV